MKRIATYTVGLLAVLAVCAPGYAADRAQTTNDHKMASSDVKFMKKAAEDGMTEVELGRLASERGSSDAVKQFGQRMATDHQKANDELMQLAQQKGVTLPSSADRKHSRDYDRLSKMSGADFDKAYMNRMVKDHDKDLKAFQREADRAKDPDLKAWAAKVTPVLQDHDQLAHQTQASVKGSATSGSASPRTSGSSSHYNK